jgi:ribonucleoside-diphosphate reductase alpha chain
VELTENARLVFEKRLLKRDREGRPTEEPEDCLRRVADNVASADERYEGKEAARRTAETFFQALSDLAFLPNSPALMNAGRRLQQLAACFVMDVGDSIESIFETLKDTALIHQSGGGTGFSFSKLRPAGDYVASSGGAASGPLSFMRVFNEATEAINQGGFRRGANMAVLRVDHPDVMDFIRSKDTEGALKNFNISVALTDAFMRALDAGEDYALVNPKSGQTVGRRPAREVFDAIVDAAWHNGEPGVLFLDRINEANPTPELGLIDATNPCGEAPLLPYESCVLGSINLTRVLRPAPAGRLEIDWDALGHLARLGVHFLDNVIDVTRHPIPQITERTLGNRKIGLGVMGFADFLFRLGIPYDSEEGVAAGEALMKFVNEQADAASIELAGRRGTFPNWPHSRFAPDGPRLRNAIRTTIAPTGTLSILAGCSSGIEPVFALAFYRFVLAGERLREVNPVFVDVARERGFYTPELVEELLRGVSLQAMPRVPADVKRLFVTSRDVAPEWHVRMQAAFQKYTDNAVSKTLNLPPDTSREEVERIILRAYELGCKGLTIYRDTSRLSQVLATECATGSCELAPPD